MKRKNVLFGLVLAVFVGSFSISSAQMNANSQNKQLIEIGPDNVGGRVRSLIASKENSGTVLYAGGVAGGLYKATTNSMGEISMWEYVPYRDEYDKEITLPITDMVQTPDKKIYIATGEGFFEHGVTNVTMAPKGYGIFVYDPTNGSFQQMTATNPTTNSEFSYINRLGFMVKEGNIYLYAATEEGLYRWKFAESENGNQLSNTYQTVHTGAVQDIAINSQQNIAFFTAGHEIYKVGNVMNENPATRVVDANTKFGTHASRIELDVNYSNNRLYLYAQVAGEDNLLNGVYLTHDQQNWTKLTTSTITPFTETNPGHLSNAIAIDPFNHDRIIIGGATLWVGEGFIENSNYMWNKVSYSEHELNSGNYMNYVYFSVMFVHSGIHAIVPHIIDTANYYVMYYIVTDGGIFCTDNFSTFYSMNKGFNTTQFNSIAVAPDGSLLGGAVNNAAPFIESRVDHMGGTFDSAWYDNEPNRINHMSSILWTGSGADVATSMFQQVKPQSRRGIFVSSDGGMFGRSYADYGDFTNTQTWTTGSYFVSYTMASGPEQPKYVLWETTNNTNWNDSITFTIDTLGEIHRNGESVPLSGDFNIQAGDVLMVPSLAHFSYPIHYTFPTSFVAKENMTHKIANPIANRLFITGFDGRGRAQVMMNCTPTDFRCVCDTATASSQAQMNWVTVYKNNHGYRVDNIAVSNDADAVFINVYDTASNTSAIYRVRGLSKSDVNNFNTMDRELTFESEEVNNIRQTVYDTIVNGSEFRFDRPITSMSYDKREGRDVLIITFGGFEGETANMAIVNNASSDNYTFRMTPVAYDTVGFTFTVNDPIYSAMVEITNGDIFIGTEKGVFKSTANSLYAGNAQWHEYGDFRGVPVKSIIQQTASLPTQHFDMHVGINTETYVFAKTKYPYAVYFGTYGRGIFMDMSYVTDFENEIVDSNYWTGITNVDRGSNSVRIYPNPAVDNATLDITLTNDANTIVKIYDISGRVVYTENLGRRAAGNYTHKINCSNFMRGMYLVNVVTGRQTATSKLIVR